MPCVLFNFKNFVPSRLLSVKIKKIQVQLDFKLDLIEVQFSAICPFKILIFVASELLGTKTEESKINKILNHIYIF